MTDLVLDWLLSSKERGMWRVGSEERGPPAASYALSGSARLAYRGEGSRVDPTLRTD
jgi:hypothetical protein